MEFSWDYTLFGNSLKSWAIALGIIIGSVLILRLARLIVLARLKKWSVSTKTGIDDLIVRVAEKVILPFLYFMAFYAGMSYLDLGKKGTQAMNVALMVVATFFAIRFLSAVIAYFINGYALPLQQSEIKGKQVRGLIVIANIIVWIIGVLFLINNLGYNVSTVLTGLGIGGLAIALATQAILGDLFSYFVIFFDKPFEIGDFIIVGDKMGVVENTGIKTTRIRALSGEQVVMSNTDLTNSRVQNFKRMEKRRVVFSIRLSYDTEASKLRNVPQMVKEIILSHKEVQFDRAHFWEFGEWSLNVEVVYYVLSPDYNLFMDIHQSIHLKIVEAFENEAIVFAAPVRKLVLD